jgi:hypothetical protein
VANFPNRPPTVTIDVYLKSKLAVIVKNTYLVCLGLQIGDF